ncbi:MAG: cardiolipin synthase [Kiritimatiellaceae bacterium]|nr:cardiolipin synthase [Kiritimatiellaceae bacterium]
MTPSLILLPWLILHIILFVLITLHCLQRRRNASSTILWIFIAFSLPILGALLYLSFGIDRVGDRGFLKFLTDQHLLEIRRTTPDHTPHAHRQHPDGTTADDEFQREFNRTLDALLPDHPPLTGNTIHPLVSGDEAYPAMLNAIRNARHHIHLQSFIIGNDSISHEFIDALAAKARTGVEVRLLYDRFGSTPALFGRLFHKANNIPHFRVAGWTQANLLKRQFQINLRNHRKSLIIDGTIAFFGGVNIQSKNTSAHRAGPIRDYHFQAEGPIVQEIQYSFLRDWYFITQESPQKLLTTAYFPPSEPTGHITARLIDSGPSTLEDLAVESFFSSTVLAKKQILAVTPYFVPSEDILRALRSAALRGVDVRLVVPQKNNHRFAGYANRALYEDLLLAGVRIYERRPPFLHAKAFIVDGKFALVGTANLDVRSLHLNYETCIAIFSESFADAMKDIIHEDIDDYSDEIILAKWQHRPKSQQLLENLASLMTPVL